MEKADISDLLQGEWTIQKDRGGNDTGELVCGNAHISVRLMGRDHADEVELARAIKARVWEVTGAALREPITSEGGTAGSPLASQCQCPLRPYLGGMARDSQMQIAADQRWEQEHGTHPYAKARDKLASAMQTAEGEMGSGEAMWQAAQEIMGLK